MTSDDTILRGESAELGTLRSALGTSESETAVNQLDQTWLAPFQEVRMQVVSEEESFETQGKLAISEESLYFCAKSELAHDMIVPATCIELHALSEDPVAVYVQLNAEPMLELTIHVDKDDCQRIFDTLTKLVCLNPVVDDDEDDEGMMYGEDMIVAASDEEDDVPPTEEERAAMLERLDNMLEVPPEYEQKDGQFDDAEDDELL